MYKILPIILIGLFFHQRAQSQCNAAFYYTVTGATVQVHAADSTPLKTHNWSFGDGSYGWGSYTSHTYAATGTYNILHVLVDSVSGCRDTAIQQVTINAPVSCHASFAFTPDSIHPHYYHYYSTSTATGGSVQSYQWTVDGHVLSTASTLNWADSSGSHVICLRIQTTAGCVSTTCDSVTTSDTTNICHLTAGFTATASAVNPLSVSFYATPAASTYTYSWYFGDGQYSTAQAPTHVYGAPGNYPVVLFVTDSIGHCFDSTFRYVYVQGPHVDSCNLTASFTATVSPVNSMLVNFAPTPAGSTWTYSWYFGDGQYSSLQSPAHLYNIPGSYLVTLIISDSIGHCYDSAYKYVYVQRPRVDSCTVSFTHTANPSQPNQVSFTAVSSDSAVSYFWFVAPCDTLTGPFPDSVVFNTPGFTYTFNTPGCYRICLSLLTRSGCRKYYCDTVQIQNNPGVRLIASYPNPATGSAVNIGLSLEKSEKVKVSVYNSFGRLVYTLERPYTSGQNKIDIPVTSLQKGTYYVDIQYGNTRKRSVFQKL